MSYCSESSRINAATFLVGIVSGGFVAGSFIGKLCSGPGRTLSKSGRFFSKPNPA
jgi:hypothetical protein